MEQVPSKFGSENTKKDKSRGVFSYVQQKPHAISIWIIFFAGLILFLVGSLSYIVPFIGIHTIPASLKEEVTPPPPEVDDDEVVSVSPYHTAYGVVELISGDELHVRVQGDDSDMRLTFTIADDTEFTAFSFADDNDTTGTHEVLSKTDIQLGDRVAVYTEDALEVSSVMNLRKLIKLK